MVDVVEDGQIAILLSLERLAPFIAIAGTEGDAIRLHNQCLRLSSALMPVIALTEIALRNAICERLRLKLGVPNWLTSPPAASLVWRPSEKTNIASAVIHAQRAAYAKLTNADKKALDVLAFPNGVPQALGHAKRSKQRQAKIQVGIGQAVAQLSMFFWKRLFSDDYETSLWKPILRALFPNKSVSRINIAHHLEVIYQARNRIAHHEAIIGDRLTKLMDSIEFVNLNFGSKAPSDSAILAQLTRPFRQLLEQEIEVTKKLVDSFSMT